MSGFQFIHKAGQLERRSARTPVSSNAGFDRSQLHHIGQQGKRPPTPSLPAGEPLRAAAPRRLVTGAAPRAAERSEQRSWVKGRSALAAGVMIDGLAAIITPSRLLGVLNDDRTTTFI